MRSGTLLRSFWLGVGLLVAPAASASPSLAKLDPNLLAVSRLEPERSIAVWVTFRDKGEQGPGDLAAALARAELALDPRTRARRERARVWPMVDYHDLPVCDLYVRGLEAQGLRPLAISRWFNRAAVRLPAGRLAALAESDVVGRIDPVATATRPDDWVEETTASIAKPAGSAWGEAERKEAANRRDATTGRSVTHAVGVDYGRTRGQITQLNLPALHDSGYVGTGVLICVLDAGFSEYDRHEALRDHVFQPGRRRDFVDGDSTVTGASHGTWVLGCVAGNKPGSYVGSAFGAEFALGRTENESREQPIEMLYWGMGAEWADEIGADIISSSLGYSDFEGTADDYTYAQMDGHTTDITRAAEIAASKGILVVNAVGNFGNTSWHYLVAPADVHGDSLIAVGAVDSLGAPGSFSSYGPSADGRIKPDLVARGVTAELVSTSGNPTAYTTGSGTSFSAPLVAGLAACLMQRHPLWTPQQVIRALRETASRALRPDNRRGYGIPDALAASRWPDIGPPPPSGVLGIQLIGPNPLRLEGQVALVRITTGDPGTASLEARLRVMDAQGRRVRDLWSGTLVYGRWELVSWDGTDRDGRKAAPGAYWIALQGAGDVSAVRLVALD